MFIDEAEITFIGGHGGAGKVAFYPGKKSGPSGGNGGNGGNVYITATSDLTALRPYTTKKALKAEDGKPGGHQRLFGKNGQDLLVSLPLGSVLIDEVHGAQIELNSLDDKILVCQGGLGGRGNFEFRSSTLTTPRFAETGAPGESKHFKIYLKLIADFGLIGLPNSGKSSLLNILTSAHAKVGNYSFTTLEPNLGVFEGKTLADIPGLIEGASKGKGLGVKFLKHIEKTQVLIHCISAESEDPLKDYRIVRNELEVYNQALILKKEIIVLTKADLFPPQVLQEKLNKLQELGAKAITISIYDEKSLNALKKILAVDQKTPD